jgi:hypothetical protein
MLIHPLLERQYPWSRAGIMGIKSIGTLILLAGVAISACGWLITRRFSAEVNYDGVGRFRLTRAGFAWFVGYLLIILGICTAAVSLMLLFL